MGCLPSLSTLQDFFQPAYNHNMSHVWYNHLFTVRIWNENPYPVPISDGLHACVAVTYLQLKLIAHSKVDLWRAMIPLTTTNPYELAMMTQNPEFDNVHCLQCAIKDLSFRNKRSVFREGNTNQYM